MGFDWDNKEQVWAKVLEELEELKIEVDNGDKTRTESEFGDLMFALINYSRFINVNPEDALEKTNRRFVKRFQIMEGLINEDGVSLDDMNLDQMDIYWNKAKEIYCMKL